MSVIGLVLVGTSGAQEPPPSEETLAPPPLAYPEVEAVVGPTPGVPSISVASSVNLVCYVAAGRRAKEREVAVGPSNQDHVVIEKGLRQGERVCLRDPGASPSDFGSLATP